MNDLLRRIIRQSINFIRPSRTPKWIGQQQNLAPYWCPEMLEAFETWGEDNAWHEIQFLLANRWGRVLDIACGTGKVIEILEGFPNLELYGCDISDFLIERAIERGVDKEHLRVCNVIDTEYEDKFFDYSYSIGSLEHFTEDSILDVLKEANRVTRLASFHHIPICREKDEGWITSNQSYFNNSIDWWLPKFHSVFSEVQSLRSNWNDSRSVGQWFICQCRDTQEVIPRRDRKVWRK